MTDDPIDKIHDRLREQRRNQYIPDAPTDISLSQGEYDALRASENVSFTDTDDTDAGDRITDITTDIAQRVAERENDVVQAAILGTDWRETAVLRIIHGHPDTMSFAVDEPLEYTFDMGSVDIERYEKQAPPLSSHSRDAGDVQVTTITWPLLERLAEHHEQVAAVVDAALSPDTGDE